METTPEWKAAIARMMEGRTFPAVQHAEVPSAFALTNAQIKRQAAALLSLIPRLYHRPQESTDAWWIGQPQVPVAAPVATVPVQSTNEPNDWGDIQKEVSQREAITDQLGDFSKRVLSNRWFMGTE